MHVYTPVVTAISVETEQSLAQEAMVLWERDLEVTKTGGLFWCVFFIDFQLFWFFLDYFAAPGTNSETTWTTTPFMSSRLSSLCSYGRRRAKGVLVLQRTR